MIEVRDLTLAYGQGIAVDALELDVRRGEALVLLGASGCGKTSVMRCIAGLEEPRSGSIVVDGRTVFDAASGVRVPPHRRNVGMVFQSYAIWPHKTVFDNVAFALRMKGLPRGTIAARVADALVLVGMGEFAGRGASLLSGGQMQRIALARSIVMEPAVLLLDEPLSNLDARLRDRLRVELRQIQQRLGMTWIYVTHDQDEAFALADRVAVMERGRIAQVGPAQDVYRRPASASIADFVGVDNVLPATLLASDGEVATARLQGTGATVRGVLRADPGAPLFACVRAEDVRIVDPGVAPGALDVLDGEIARVDFAGGLVRCVVTVGTGTTLTTSRSRGDSAPRVGERVRLGIGPGDVTFVPESNR